MISRFIQLLLTASFLCVATVQDAQSLVNWLTWEEAAELSKAEPRKFFVDVYTDWCGWCKKMDKATFQNATVAEYLNTHFYPIKFNAEYREEIRINERVYQFVRGPGRNYHQLAAEITFGRLQYPTIVFLDEEFKVIQPIPGFKDPTEMQIIIHYFAGDHHKTTPWTRYREQFVRN